jgi:D-alanyl-D-alanine endopeptidase (penicillin-binding protein 7)
MLSKFLTGLLFAIATTAAVAVPFRSQYALVVEDDTGKVLFEKNPDAVVPIASLTKLMTAMVILDSNPDMDAPICIDQMDVDVIKHSTSHVPVGVILPRRAVLQLALMSSDNRAAASLARTYPGGNAAFAEAVNAKIKALGMTRTVIEEPTGLSANNKSTASDLVKMAAAAAQYEDIARITTDSKDLININGRAIEYRNTNKLVGKKGWDILLSKTGFTDEAGRCLIMRLNAAGKKATLVLLNARESSSRALDALNIRRFLANEAAPLTVTVPKRKRQVIQVSTHKQRRYLRQNQDT